MNLRKAALACLGIAGACLIIAGCGGGDLPDPSVDGSPAADAGSGPPPEIGNSAGRPAAPAVAPGRLVSADTPAKTDESTEAPAAAADSPRAGQPQRSEGSSVTAEMLAMATNPSAGPASPAAAASGPSMGGAGGTPSQMQQMMGSQGASRPGAAGCLHGDPERRHARQLSRRLLGARPLRAHHLLHLGGRGARSAHRRAGGGGGRRGRAGGAGWWPSRAFQQ